MTIYFINKNSKIKGPFDIMDSHHNKIIRIGDICIHEGNEEVAFLMICNDINKWTACKCIGKASGNLGLEVNQLLFSFNGINKRYGRIDSLHKLSDLFAKQQPILDVISNAIDITNYKCDYWNISLFLNLHKISKLNICPQSRKKQDITSEHFTNFESYLTKESLQLFRELLSLGYSLRESYEEIKRQHPKDFRLSLRKFLTDNPKSTIYEK